MNRFLIFVSFVFVSFLAGCASSRLESKLVSVPGSSLVIAMPPDWSESELYGYRGKNALSIGVPSDLVIEGHKTYSPVFRVEFHDGESLGEMFIRLGQEITADLRGRNDFGISGFSGASFWFETEVTYDFLGGGAITSKEIHYEIAIEVDGGVLSCSVTASPEEVEENKQNLLRLCGSARKVI